MRADCLRMCVDRSRARVGVRRLEDTSDMAVHAQRRALLISALRTQHQRARRLVAHTQDSGGEQTHKGQCICIVARALLPAAPSSPILLPVPPHSLRATSQEAHHAHGGQRRRAGARGTVRPHSCSRPAACPYPSLLIHHLHPHPFPRLWASTRG